MGKKNTKGKGKGRKANGNGKGGRSPLEGKKEEDQKKKVKRATEENKLGTKRVEKRVRI
jgi:hypothetical protein